MKKEIILSSVALMLLTAQGQASVACIPHAKPDSKERLQTTIKGNAFNSEVLMRSRCMKN